MAIKELECPNCGANLGKVRGNVLFCEYCGSKLKKEEKKQESVEGMQNFFDDSFDMPTGNFTSHTSYSTVTVTKNGKTVHLSGEEAREMSEEINENVQRMMSQFFGDKK